MTKHAPLWAVPTDPGLLPPRATRLPRIVAVAVGCAGLLTLLSAALSPIRGGAEFIQQLLPLSVRSGASSAAALAGFGTLVIAGALARRERRAWWIAVVLLVVAGVSHLIKDVDVPSAGVNLGMAAVLISARREFNAHPGPGSVRRAVLTLPALAVLVWGFGVLAILAHAADLHPRPTPSTASLAAVRGAIGLSLGFRIAGEGGWIPAVLPLLGVSALAMSFAVCFRPVVERLRAAPGAAERARDLVRAHGSDTLAYFALRGDKSYFFDGNAVIAYTYLWNLGLVSGDPIGDPSDVPGAMEAFVRHARSHGWGVAVLAGGTDLAPAYARLGLRSFYLGDEAILRPPTFSLEGRPIRKVRQSCHRLQRLGFRLEVLADSDADPDLRDALSSISRSWRGRSPERGFTMALGRDPSAEDPDCLTVVARDGVGRAQGYLHLVPCYGPEPGYSLDQMRRRPETPNGLVEWMVATTTLELGRRGVGRFSLNFSLLGALFRPETRLSPLQRLEVAVARRLNPFFQIERLHDFNAKFFPEWTPRYIYYEPPLSLPRVALAYLEAEAFVRLPLIGARSRFRVRPEGPGTEAPSARPGSAASAG